MNDTFYYDYELHYDFNNIKLLKTEKQNMIYFYKTKMK